MELWRNIMLLLLGSFIGLLLGILIQKGRLSRFDTILGQFLFKDFTFFKIILTALLTGSISMYGLHAFGIISSINICASSLKGVMLGGLLFGVGLAIVGYEPLTSFAAAGEGARDAVVGIMGMVVGSVLYSLIDPPLRFVPREETRAIPDLFGLAPWWFILALGLIFLGMVLSLWRTNRQRGY